MITKKIIKQDTANISINKPSTTYSTHEFILEIESIWNLQATYTTAPPPTLDKLQANYSSFQKHFTLIKTILNHYLAREINILAEMNDSKFMETKFQDLLIHLINLIKATLTGEYFLLDHHAEDLFLKRERFILLIVWLRLLTEAFGGSLEAYELCANFINILSTMNLCLMDKSSLNASCMLHFVQNDAYFCEEFLKFLSTFIVLTGSLNSSDDAASTRPYQSLSEYVIKSIFETNSILIR